MHDSNTQHPNRKMIDNLLKTLFLIIQTLLCQIILRLLGVVRENYEQSLRQRDAVPHHDGCSWVFKQNCREKFQVAALILRRYEYFV